jgi:hypothetical protein
MNHVSMTNADSGSVGTSINIAGSKETQVFLSHLKMKQQLYVEH